MVADVFEIEIFAVEISAFGPASERISVVVFMNGLVLELDVCQLVIQLGGFRTFHDHA